MENKFFPYDGEEKIANQIEEIRKIYNHIDDDVSKSIFVNRIMLSLTDDIMFLKKMILSTDCGKSFYDFLIKHKKHIYLYGAGIRGCRIAQMFSEMDFLGFIDKNKKGTLYGLDICPLDSLISDSIILITNYQGADEIKTVLESNGIERERIYTVNELEENAREDLYFEERCVCSYMNQGAFVDAGCFDGADVEKYIKKYSNKSSVYAFEPDTDNYEICNRKLSKYEHIHLLNIGLGEKEEVVTFCSGEGEWARIDNQGNKSLQINSLDNVVDEKISFIKMDIEGSEINALLGAKKHIMNDCPMIAVSIYHKREDIIEIPRLLLKLNANYKFRFGHYFVTSSSDTVLYAY